MGVWRRTLAWLRLRERQISAGVALLGFGVGFLSILVAVFQAGLLYSQRATPYRTAVYARQLEIAENLVGAAHEQHLRLINLHNDCVHRVNGRLGDSRDYIGLSQDFRSGAQALHIAYGATLASYPAGVHERARQILAVHEGLYDEIVAPSGTCHDFLILYRQHDASSGNARLYELTGQLVNQLRQDMGVEALSWPEPVREAVRATATAKPE